jgi:hypothetical protein
MSSAAQCITWRRCAALPVCEGEEIECDDQGTLTLDEAVRMAEANAGCCAFVRNVERNWYFWKRADTGFEPDFIPGSTNSQKSALQWLLLVSNLGRSLFRISGPMSGRRTGSTNALLLWGGGL